MTEHEDTRRRNRDVGQGYPEEGQPGTGVDAREHAEDEVAHDPDAAPQTSTDEDGDPSQATGNRNAAGG